MRRFFCLAVLAAGSSVLYGQVCTPANAPCISSLQSDFPNAKTPTRGAAITAGTPASPGIWLFINGTFTPPTSGLQRIVTWAGTTASPPVQQLGIVSVTTTQIVAAVPVGLFSSADTASITVSEGPAGAVLTTSNASPYTVNPAMAPLTLANAVAGTAYAQPLASGGTANFAVSLASGTLPPGMSGPYQPGPSNQTNTNLNGTPTTAGTFSFLMQIVDAWGNSITPQYALTVVSPPVIQSLSQNSAPVGSCTLITITGQNFGSEDSAVFLVGAASNQLTTTFVSATQLVAQLPTSLTTAPGSFAIYVQQAGGSASPPTSNQVPFTLLSPVITSLVRSFGTVGAAAGSAMIVNGANFAAPGNSTCPATGAVVTFAGAALVTGFVSSGQLTTALPAMPTTPGSVAVSVVNQSFSSAAASFTVNPAPTVSSVAPAFCTVSTSATAGCTNAALPIQISGANFSAGAAIVNGVPNNQQSVLWDNVQIGLGAVTNGSVIAISVPQGALTAGSHSVATMTYDGVVSNKIAFTVDPTPVLSSLQPASVTAGSAGFNLTINGANFLNGMTVRWQGPSGTATFTPASPTPAQMIVSIPANLLTAAGAATVTVFSTDAAPVGSNSLNFTIVPAPVLTSLQPGSVQMGSAAFTLTVNGTNFLTGMTVQWKGPSGTLTLPAVTLTANQITVAVPASYVAAVGTAAVSVLSTDAVPVASNALTFTIYSALRITTTSLPSATLGTNYNFTLAATGGVQPYNWTATGLPAGLGLNSSTGQITGTPTGGSTPSVSVTVTDQSGQTATARFVLPVVLPNQPLVIATGSPLTPATATVYYSNVIAATGGNNASYTFATTSGSVPPGMTFFDDGRIVGTAPAPGTFNFSVQVTDASGNTASKAFTLVVNPPPLIITTGPFGPMQVGGAVNTPFAAKGGVPPYTFSSSGTLPPGTQFTSGTLAGTLTTAGSYSFTVTVTDSTQTNASQGYTIVVAATSLTITTTSPLTAGQLGVQYPGVQFQATGGSGTYTWSADGTPPGLSLSSAGALSGTPTKAGTFTIPVAVVDSNKATANGSFSITISGITITTASLPNGVVGTAYGGAMAATGGIGALTWSASGLPASVALSPAGNFGGAPTATGTSSVTVTATDSAGNTASKTYTLTVTNLVLTITASGPVPAGTVGTGFSLGFSASGGASPYTFSATGLPAGLTISSTSGTISGAPTAAGTSSVTVTVTDSTGATASTAVTINVALPITPGLSFTGISVTENPGSQSSVGVSLESAYPVTLTAKLTLTFSATDPAVQFATGGLTATITIPAGETAGSTTVGVQTGTVAGTITITAQLLAGTQDVTPTPTPTQKITVPTTAPVISSITATRNSGGFTVTIIGYSSTRALATANFTFSGAGLGTTSLSIPVDAIFSPWYQSSTSSQFGSNFTYTQTFTTNSPQAVTSVTASLVNAVGTSATASANLQ
ncbi:MAG TPA: putative Ig domain-containing protein [Bryobacteraceae bacterium]|nr:putative Ig domain-containing protein [Bryobacteraceae bacterium]